MTSTGASGIMAADHDLQTLLHSIFNHEAQHRIFTMPKIWMVTGSARGLGRSVVTAALAAGDFVVATARDTEGLADLVASYPQTLATFELDVTDELAAQAAADLAVKRFGRIDVLVNNAGFGHIGPFEQTSSADFRSVVETNFFGVVNLTRAVIPFMREQRSGHIINISSIAGRMGAPGLASYTAAKFAVSGFTESVQAEAASFGVKVIAIEPGGMRTEWNQAAQLSVPELLPAYETSVGVLAATLKNYAGSEMGDPEKVAGIILKLSQQDNLPVHLLLGSDAIALLDQADAVRGRAAAEWSEISRLSDSHGTDPAILAALTDAVH
jgi:NAD(P)-dependent dehydrogenase (short-subunit alcohol dehydrogenase family)